MGLDFTVDNFHLKQQSLPKTLLVASVKINIAPTSIRINRLPD